MTDALRLREVIVAPGIAIVPFELEDFGYPKWWQCPSCLRLDTQSVYHDSALHGFFCHNCQFNWHYEEREQTTCQQQHTTSSTEPESVPEI